ncbi:synaptopodin-2 [Brienomyrus brachyistius]|uniref:synaptopodin-2 n=1 Tax=Brienomyrus brachyistius TaxID=42636 RepID=UPI0020B1B828|nr:synaptopodin-2 [Brienomyrus brachyistius]
MSLERCCPCVFRRAFCLLRLHPPGKPCISESQDGPRYGRKENDVNFLGGSQTAWTADGEYPGSEAAHKGSVSSKAMVELYISDHRPEEPPHGEVNGSLGLGGVHLGALSSIQSLYIYRSDREYRRWGGQLQDSTSCSLGQAGVTLQLPRGGCHGEEVGAKREAKASGWVDPPEEGGNREAPPASVSFGISAVGARPAERWDSESERDLGQPNKHRARLARFRRSESQLEKQAKVAKSKCKRISLLLTAAPNPKSKGVLMFEKHRERAKKYTLVSYGTGREEPESEDEEDYHRIEVTFLANGELQLDGETFANASGYKIGVNFDKDSAPPDLDKKLDHRVGMEYLPETKGKGALMFARRRQRIDEIAATHEEMRQKGIPVEGPLGPENMPSYQSAEHTYKQSPDSQSHEVNVEVAIQQHQAPQYPPTMNGTAHYQPGDLQRFQVPNRTAQPFSGVPNRVPVPFSPSVGIPSPVLDQPGYSDSKLRVNPPPVPVTTRPQVLSPTDREQIVSRDERISVPAIRTGMLHDTKKRSAAKTAFGSKESSTMSSLNLPKGDKRPGFDLSVEEDFLSLGAEACNFLQAPVVKHKTPPPVAPKPSINLASPPWLTENTQLPLASGIPTSAIAPTASPALVGSPQQHTTTSTWNPPELHPPLQQPVSAWAAPEPKVQPPPGAAPWGMSQPQAPAQPPWAEQRIPVTTVLPTQNQLRNSWNQPYISAKSVASHLSTSTYGSRFPSVGGASSARAMSPASDMPTMRGRGAELFAKRQSRMEKFVVDSETVQANKARAQSPSPSLPSAWKYSSIVRAPPPSSYNPLLTPSYPPAAVKSPPSSSAPPKPKTTEKGKPAPKHINSLDVMKHQPYQLNASLFTYSPSVEEKATTSATQVPPPTGQASKPTAPGSCRTYSQSLPRRLPSMSSRSGFESSSSTPVFEPSWDSLERQTSWQETTTRPAGPWESMGRSTLGQSSKQRRRSEGFYPAPPAFIATAKSPLSPPASSTQYGPSFGQYQSQRSMPEDSTRYSGSSSGLRKPVNQQVYRPLSGLAWRH